MTNPYRPPSEPSAAGKYFGSHAVLIRGGFLYREIQFAEPIPFRFVYSGWNFVQRIRIDDVLVWRRISWVVIHRQATFQMPREIDPNERRGEMRITFTRSLRIQRFQVRLGEEVLWDE